MSSLDMSTCRSFYMLAIVHYLAQSLSINFCCSLLFFQKLTGERKQMAKAIAAASKSSKTLKSFKKHSAVAPSSAPPSKRHSFPDKTVVCFNCQQTGHISPRCPSRPSASSTPAAKSSSVIKWGVFCPYFSSQGDFMFCLVPLLSQ